MIISPNRMFSSSSIFLLLGLPLTFLLGFYVSLVVKRWWEQYCFLPWPDSIAFFLRGLVVGGEEVRKGGQETDCFFAAF